MLEGNIVEPYIWDGGFGYVLIREMHVHGTVFCVCCVSDTNILVGLKCSLLNLIKQPMGTCLLQEGPHFRSPFVQEEEKWPPPQCQPRLFYSQAQQMPWMCCHPPFRWRPSIPPFCSESKASVSPPPPPPLFLSLLHPRNHRKDQQVFQKTSLLLIPS